MDAAIISSSANVAGGIIECFNDPEKEVKLEDVQLAPMSFVDDIGKLSDTTEAAQYGNDKMQLFVCRFKDPIIKFTKVSLYYIWQ